MDALIGFAVKAGKVLYGADTIETAKKPIYLIILCNTAAENTRKKVLRLAETKKIPVAESLGELQHAVARANCKAIAVTDRQMASAMRGFLGQNYRSICSEVK